MNSLNLILLINLIFSIMITNCQTDLPSYFPRCFRDDPEINDCLLKAANKVKPYVCKGVPELNIQPVNVLKIPKITLSQGTNVVNYKATFRNLTILGLDNYEFTKFDFYVKNLSFWGTVNINNLYVEGNYMVNGKVLSVPLEGNGFISANISNSNGTLYAIADIVMRNGIEYMRNKLCEIKINVGDVQFQIQGLFDDNEILAKAIRNVLDENLRVLIEEVKPAIEKVISGIVRNYVKKALSHIPYDNIFPKKNK